MIENRKDSGVEWVGEIPESWNILPLGNCFTERNEKVSDYDWEPLSVTKQGILKQLESAAKSDAHDARKKVCKNDFVINSRSDRKQSCGVSPYDGSVSLINIVLENRFLNPDYVKYLLNNYGFAEEFYRWGTGIVADLWSTKWERMKKIMLPIPPVEVQSKIAKKLDDEIFKIDERITLTKQIIEDYKKYKQSVITEAVTKGLNPDVEMKDSGIEWIGEIPEHWEITKVKFLYNIVLGKMLCNEPKDETYTLENYLCSQNVKWNGIDTTTIKKMWFSEQEKSLYLLNEGDLVITEGGSIGESCIYKGEYAPCYIQNAVHKATGRGKNKNKLLYYWLQILETVGYFNMICNRATIAHYTKEKVENTPIIHIPQDEQEEIVELLDKKCTEIDNLISAKEQLIEDMESYKKSLIYEYVTGKKEVSDNE